MQVISLYGWQRSAINFGGHLTALTFQTVVLFFCCNSFHVSTFHPLEFIACWQLVVFKMQIRDYRQSQSLVLL